MTHYLFLADGFEEVEAITPVDVLRRTGLKVVTVSVGEGLEVAGAHGVTVRADRQIADTDFTGAGYLILPGGQPGTTHLAACEPLRRLLLDHAARGGRLAAICAAPSVLGDLGLLRGKRYTCYPGCEKPWPDARKEDEGVSVDGDLVTAAGPAMALPFALNLLERLQGVDRAEEIAHSMIF